MCNAKTVAGKICVKLSKFIASDGETYCTVHKDDTMLPIETCKCIKIHRDHKIVILHRCALHPYVRKVYKQKVCVHCTTFHMTVGCPKRNENAPAIVCSVKGCIEKVAFKCDDKYICAYH
jgi:hypothetical protein